MVSFLKKFYYYYKRKLKLHHKIIILFISSLVLYLFFETFKIKSQPLQRNNSLCFDIKNVSYEDNKMHISFSKPISNINNISAYFGYQTTAFNMPLTFQPNSFTNVIKKENDLFIQFDLPFVQYYTGHLYCSSTQYDEILENEKENNQNKKIKSKSLSGPKNFLQQADSLYPLSFNKTNFDYNAEWSQIKCFGETYETRFCEMLNVAIYKDLLVFSTKATYSFPQPFLTLDARAPPFNRKEAILGFEPVVLDKIINSHDNTMHEKSYLINQFDISTNNVWNVVVDFLIPALVTIQYFENTHEIRNRNIIIRDTKYNIDTQFMNCLSLKQPILLWENSEKTYKFDHLIVGLKKLEANPSSARSKEDKYKIKYSFTEHTCPYLHDLVFNSFNIHPLTKNDDDYQKILLIENKSLNKTFINQEEIEQYMKASCDFCDIDVIDVSKMSRTEIMELFSSAHGIVGMHSDEIANAIWMKPEKNVNKIIFELFPNGFHCNKKHKNIAKLNNFKYFSIVGSEIPQNDDKNKTTSKKLKDCLEDEYLCSTSECFSVLENQDLYVDISSFSYVWDSIVETLRNDS